MTPAKTSMIWMPRKMVRSAIVACSVWLLLLWTVKSEPVNNCRDSDNNPSIVTSVEGMTPTLTVDCRVDDNKVLLNMNSGGILVTNFVYVFEECIHIGLNGSEVSGSHKELLVAEIYSEYLWDDREYEQQVEVDSPHDPIHSAHVVCSFHGCYESAPYEYDRQYYISFMASTNCTFSQQTQVSPSHSMSTIQTMMSSFTSGMQHSSLMAQLQPTSVTTLSKRRGSSVTSDFVQRTTPKGLSTAASSHSTTNSGSAMYQGTSGMLFLLSFLLILFPVVLAVVFAFFIIQKSKNLRMLKNKSQCQKQEWSFYDDDEPIDANFSPVTVDMPVFPWFNSTPSIVTDLDELNHYCDTTPDQTTVSIRGGDDTKPSSEAPERIDKPSSLYDRAESNNGGEKRSSIGHTDLQDLQIPTHTTYELTQQKRVFLEPLEICAYNSSLGSNEYVQLCTLHNYSGGTVDIAKCACSQQRTLANH